ncbi:MAG: hypothetical protein ABIG40_03420 [Parcubacteria group bacterium]
MNTKILVISIVLIGLVIGGYFVWKNISAPENGKIEIEEGIVPAPSGEVQVYKGIWMPTSLSNDPNKLDSDIQKLKDIGVNTIFLPAAPPHLERCLEGLPSDSELAKKLREIIPIQKEIMIANIQAAHRNGLRVGLAMTKCFPAAEDITLEEWDFQIIENAKLAEEYRVELFAPMNEPEVLFGPSASANWGQEILPKIREVYHGKVVWKGASIGDIQPYPMTEPASTNYSGYDYIGVTISRGLGTTLEDFSPFVDYALNTFLGFAERDNCKGVMITEFYGTSMRESIWNEELNARAHEIVLEKGRDKVAGFFALDFLGLSIFGEDIPGMPDPEKSQKAEEVIKRYFTEILD